MPNLHVLMTNHDDIEFTKFLAKQVSLIKEKYNTLLLECVPFGKNGKDALNYIEEVLMSATFDLSNVRTSLTNVQKRALVNKFSLDTCTEKKIELKYEAIEALMQNKHLRISESTSPLYILNNFHYYFFISKALSAKIELIGIEAHDYYPHAHQVHRNQAFVENVIKIASEENRRCLIYAGASHGIDLIKATIEHPTLKANFTHVYFDPIVLELSKTAASQIFRHEIESGHYSLSDNQSYLFLDLTHPKSSDREHLFKIRVLETESVLPIYHTYGHKHFEELGAASKKIKNLSGLSLFSSLDQDYYVDTIAEISSFREFELAARFQIKTGLGRFYQTDIGKTLFVIKHTNDPKHFDTLRSKLYS